MENLNIPIHVLGFDGDETYLLFGKDLSTFLITTFFEKKIDRTEQINLLSLS